MPCMHIVGIDSPTNVSSAASLPYYLTRDCITSVPVPMSVLVVAVDTGDQGRIHHLEEIDLPFFSSRKGIAKTRGGGWLLFPL